MVRTRVRLSVLGAVAAALVAVPGNASAITLGETFVPPLSNCSPNFTRLQPDTPGDQYVAPAAGVITSWSFEADNDPPDMRFKVARPEGGGLFTIIGQSGLEDPAPSELNTFPVNIPVQAGDVIGNYITDPDPTGCQRSVPDHPIFVRFGEVLLGETATFFDDGDSQLDLSAELEPYRCGGKNATLAGTAGKDELVGTSGDDVIVAFGGKDTIKGKGGADVACGGNGKDKLKGGADNDKLKGQKGNDAMKGAAGEDKCVGGKGKDTAKKCEVTKSL
jgi:hypothetical protein